MYESVHKRNIQSKFTLNQQNNLKENYLAASEVLWR